MTDTRARKRIGVIGGSRATKKHLDMAAEVGRLIAEKGAVLICGGLAGVMEAACRAAKKAGGLTVGILPGGIRRKPTLTSTFPSPRGWAIRGMRSWS